VTDHVTLDHPRLDNVAWHALTTVQSAFADVCGTARRYHPDVSVFAALDTGTAAEWADLATLVGPDGTAALFRCDPVAVPDGWTVMMEGAGHQMVFEPADRSRLLAGSRPDSRLLTVDDEPQMAALVALAQPGPWRPRTIELGDYHGVFDGDQLVAMAGERQKLPGFTEVSAVCTHPDARRRGLGAAITTRVVRGILDRGETPFLHHAEDNHGARRVYEALGFRFRREVQLVIARPSH
jgi:predicted GNAT family acetyltransferase